MQKYKKKKIFNLVTISAVPWFSNIWTSNLHHVVHLLYVNTFFKKKTDFELLSSKHLLPQLYHDCIS